MATIERSKQAIIKELRTIPGVGKSIADDLWNLGMRSIQDLKGQEPTELYDRLKVHRLIVACSMSFVVPSIMSPKSNTTRNY